MISCSFSSEDTASSTGFRHFRAIRKLKRSILRLHAIELVGRHPGKEPAVVLEHQDGRLLSQSNTIKIFTSVRGILEQCGSKAARIHALTRFISIPVM